MFCDTWTKIAMLWCMPISFHETRRALWLPIRLLFNLMPLTADLFWLLPTWYIHGCLFYTLRHLEDVVISLKSMQSSRLYFITDTTLLIMTSFLINFCKGFCSHLRHLFGGRKLPGDLERVTWSSSKNVKILIIKIFPPVNIGCILQRIAGFEGTRGLVFTTVLWDRMNMK